MANRLMQHRRHENTMTTQPANGDRADLAAAVEHALKQASVNERSGWGELGDSSPALDAFRALLANHENEVARLRAFVERVEFEMGQLLTLSTHVRDKDKVVANTALITRKIGKDAKELLAALRPASAEAADDANGGGE